MAKRKSRRKIRADQLKEKRNGLVEGEAKRKIRTDQQNGKTEEKIEIAKNLIKLGINIDYIIKATGLSKEEIEKMSKD